MSEATVDIPRWKGSLCIVSPSGLTTKVICGRIGLPLTPLTKYPSPLEYHIRLDLPGCTPLDVKYGFCVVENLRGVFKSLKSSSFG